MLTAQRVAFAAQTGSASLSNPIREEVQPAISQLSDFIPLIQRKQILIEGVANDYFGYSVAMSGDLLVVGAWGDGVSATNEQGAAYLFERNQSGVNQWGLVKKLVASDGMVANRFGLAVAIDGDSVAIGALFANIGANAEQGAVYLFERNQGGSNQWGETKKLTSSDGVASDFFGSSVALQGDTLLVGAWGAGVGGSDERGAAYLFARDQGGANQWGEVKKLSASDGLANDKFGYSVAISGDTVAVGAWGDDTGSSNERGAVYLFARNQGGSNNWGELKKLLASDGAASDSFGNSLALENDRLAVGAIYADVTGQPDQGAVYLFDRNQGGSNNWGELKKITASDGASSDFFGASVLLQNDLLMAGAWADNVESNNDQGSAYLFERNHGGADNWGEIQKLVADNGVANDNFGYSLAMAGEWVAVGAWSADIAGEQNEGTVYLFAPENQPPAVAPQSFSIDENSVNGTVVGTLSASDADAADTLAYAITGGNLNNAFAINSNSGEISVNNSTALDYETSPAIPLTVTVSDDGFPPIAVSAAITVNLNDVDDLVRTLSINDVTVNEDGGNALFTVTLSAAKATAIGVEYATNNGTANAGSDYSAVSGTLIFSPGITSRVVAVPILEDSVDESDEIFTLQLSSPVNAILGDGEGIATILDNDAAGSADLAIMKSVNVSSALVGETITYSYQIENSGAVSLSIQAVDDKLGVIDTVILPGGTALLPGTYLRPGQTAVTTKSYTIQKSDFPGPLLNTFVVTGTTPALAQLSRSTQLSVTLVAPALSTLSIQDLAVQESAGSALFEISLSAASDTPVSVHVTSRNGTATAGFDYSAVSTTVTIGAGAIKATLAIPILEDEQNESDESFFVTLSSPQNATILDAEGRGTILDNDLAGTANLQISKVADRTSAKVGDTITYSYRITNTGSISLTIQASDDKLGNIALTTVPGSTALSANVALQPGGVAQATATYTVQANDLPGPLVNTFTVTGTTAASVQLVRSAQVAVLLSAPAQNRLYLPLISRSTGQK